MRWYQGPEGMRENETRVNASKRKSQNQLEEQLSQRQRGIELQNHAADKEGKVVASSRQSRMLHRSLEGGDEVGELVVGLRSFLCRPLLLRRAPAVIIFFFIGAVRLRLRRFGLDPDGQAVRGSLVGLDSRLRHDCRTTVMDLLRNGPVTGRLAYVAALRRRKRWRVARCQVASELLLLHSVKVQLRRVDHAHGALLSHSLVACH